MACITLSQVLTSANIVVNVGQCILAVRHPDMVNMKLVTFPSSCQKAYVIHTKVVSWLNTEQLRSWLDNMNRICFSDTSEVSLRKVKASPLNLILIKLQALRTQYLVLYFLFFANKSKAISLTGSVLVQMRRLG